MSLNALYAPPAHSPLREQPGPLMHPHGVTPQHGGHGERATRPLRRWQRVPLRVARDNDASGYGREMGIPMAPQEPTNFAAFVLVTLSPGA